MRPEPEYVTHHTDSDAVLVFAVLHHVTAFLQQWNVVRQSRAECSHFLFNRPVMTYETCCMYMS